MNDSELIDLIRELSEQAKLLSTRSGNELNKKERKQKVLLRAREQALKAIQSAREKGDRNQEIRANLDYTLLTEHGDKNILLFTLMRAKLKGTFW